MNHLTQDAKKAVIEKALARKNQSLSEIASLHNIGYSTLKRWVHECKDDKLIALTAAPSSIAQLTRTEQFEHLLATSSLDDKGLGSYCREHGLYSFQLHQWKNEFMLSENSQKKQDIRSELKALRAENKMLKQDLLRKNRALAETTALLVLKKKADLLFGDREDV
jgi:transposase-like protein